MPKRLLNLPASRPAAAFAGFAQAQTVRGAQIQNLAGVQGRSLGYSPPTEDASETLAGLVVEVEIRRRSRGERRQML